MLRKNMFMAFLIIILGGMLTSCNETATDSGKPRSMGNTSEILVVVQNEEQWGNPVGKSIKDYFGQIQYGLSQGEPIYKLSHVKSSSFNNLFQKHRNILMIDIDAKAKNSKVELFKDYWAKPQRVFKVIAPSMEAFLKIFQQHKSAMMQQFNETERERILSVFRPDNNLKVVKKVMNKFGLKMVIPSGFYVAKTKPGFMWIRREAESFSQALVIISVPYKDTLQFSLRSINARTNRYLKQYIPGPTESSYMAIDQKFMLPRAKVVNDFFTDYAVEVRGLWRVEHDFMGGPFLSYSFVDWRKNQIVTMMGYVYQPNKPKRNLLLQLESLIYSTRYVDVKSTK